ncbi:MAG: hypothetical protein JWP89_682 [Schlesneria sp.]|nr:hypothetical protein [Schlesneria sp.]
MSQTPPESKPNKSGYRWLWVVLALFCSVPVMMFVGLIGLYMLRSQATFHDFAARERQHAAQAWQQQEATRTVTTQSTPVLPPVVQAPKKRAQIVRIQLDFEDFETRFANAITVDRDQQGARLMVPSEVFTPMSGKINGRIVTRTAGTPKIVGVGSWPASGMAGATMGGSPVGAGVAIPGIGLTELTLNNWDLTPIRVVGDFPEASIGDKLMVVSLPEDFGFSREVTVLGTDESVQLGDGTKLDHLLKLTEWTGTIGALATNSTGEPIGQIIFTKPGKLRYSYAVPMDRIFQAIYELKQRGSSSFPIEDEPRQGLDFRSSASGLTSEKKEDNTPGLPLAASELPPDPLHVSPSPRIDDPLLPEDFSPTPDPFRAGALPPDPSPGAPQPSKPPTPTNFPPEISPADAAMPELSPDRETKVYQVRGPAQEVAETLRSLYGDVAKIAADRTSRSVITVASPTVQEKIAATIEDLHKRGQSLEDEQAKKDELEMERMKALNARQRAQKEAARKAVATKESITEEELQKSPPGTTTSPVAEARQQVQLCSEQDREAKKLALQLRTAAPTEQPALRAKLERLTEQQFRVRQDLRKKEIDDLGNRIDQLRVTQLRRQQNQAEIIRRRVEELLDPNSDLRWEPPQDVQKAPTSKSVVGESPEVLSGVSRQLTETEEPKGASVEQTFDGITYSHWLKILETEVKPTKLAAAIEACGRLAVSADRRRIAKVIIQKASLFESADSKERDVWNAADASLAKFPMTDVVDEILISLADPESAKRGRTFQGRFLLHYPNAAKQHERELIAALVKAVQENGKDRNCLLAAACQLWHLADHQLEDFEGLRPLVMERIDGAPESTSRLDDDWYVVALALVMKNPETPDLALKLWKISTGKNDYDFQRTIELLGRLGRHAEPAVPVIIEQILVVLEQVDKIADARGASVAATPYRQHPRAIELVKTLGDIGVGAQAATLLKELCLSADAYPGNSQLFNISQEARTSLQKFARVPDVDGPPILGDEFLVRGIWQLHSANFEKPVDCEASIGRGHIDLLTSQNGNRRGISDTVDGNWIAGQVKLDPTKMVKEIVLTNPGESKGPSKRNGIYELTETSFKIYLAPLNKPAPTEMIEEGSPIPDGYSLVEWRRSLSLPPRPRN